MITRRVEGYWYSKSEPNWPKPVTGVLNESEASAIASLIKEREKGAYYVEYAYSAQSRIEKNVEVGHGEYVTDEWRWPSSLADHYVLKHKVKPSDDFLRYIGYHQ